MHPIIAFLKAIRSVNLFIVALLMYSLRWLVLKPLLAMHELRLQLTELDFFLLVLSIVLAVAAGNIINDYFDLKIDRFNKPNKILIGRYVKRRVAMVTHVFMNGIALVLAVYVGYKSGIIELALIHVICIASLWFYSTDFKRKFLVGNLIIAFCTGLVPFSVALFEIPPLIEANQEFLAEHPQSYPYFKQMTMSVLYWCLGFGVFAFLMTLVREITKDVVDMDGDAAYGCKTIPVELGIKKTGIIIALLYLLILVGVFVIQQMWLNDKYSLTYWLFVFTPLVLWMIVLALKGNHKSHFKLPSTINKVASVIGILYTFIVFLILTGRV